MVVLELVEWQVSALVLARAPSGALVKVQEPGLVLEVGVVRCASAYYSYSFSRINIAAYEQAPVKQ
jgi:hypothetical protein